MKCRQNRRRPRVAKILWRNCSDFRPPRRTRQRDKKKNGVPEKKLAAILKKTKKAASEGEFEPFKTTAQFDSTAVHPEWLGYNPQN